MILIVSVLNVFDFNYLNLKYFSFNFPFILIFFFTLKDSKHFDYLLVFLAGLINDTVVGLPLGIISLSYMLICISTSYFRNITIRPSPIKVAEFSRESFNNFTKKLETELKSIINLVFDKNITEWTFGLSELEKKLQTNYNK